MKLKTIKITISLLHSIVILFIATATSNCLGTNNESSIYGYWKAEEMSNVLDIIGMEFMKDGTVNINDQNTPFSLIEDDIIEVVSKKTKAKYVYSIDKNTLTLRKSDSDKQVLFNRGQKLDTTTDADVMLEQGIYGLKWGSDINYTDKLMSGGPQGEHPINIHHSISPDPLKAYGVKFDHNFFFSYRKQLFLVVLNSRLSVANNLKDTLIQKYGEGTRVDGPQPFVFNENIKGYKWIVGDNVIILPDRPNSNEPSIMFLNLKVYKDIPPEIFSKK